MVVIDGEKKSAQIKEILDGEIKPLEGELSTAQTILKESEQTHEVYLAQSRQVQMALEKGRDKVMDKSLEQQHEQEQGFDLER